MAITYNLRDPNFWAGHEGQTFNARDGTWGAMAQQPTRTSYYDSNTPASGPGSAIYASQQAKGMINPDGSTDASNAYNAWVAAGRPATNAQGQVYDTRGQIMAPDAWDSTFANMAANNGGTFTPGSEPLINPNSPWANGPGGGQQAPGTLGAGNGQMPGPGTPTGDEGWFGQVDPIGGVPGNGIGTTLGQLAGGFGNIGGPPGAQNFGLNVGNYMNPMMGFMLKNGFDTINNGAAAQGSLQSGDTMKQLMQYGMGVSGDAWNKAAGIAQQQQGFGYGVANNDRNFAYQAANNDRNFGYQAATGDRDFDYQRQRDMANLGLQAAGQQGTNDRLLATLISQNMNNLGQAQGTGTIGQGNANNTMLQNLIAQWLGQNTVNNAPKP